MAFLTVADAAQLWGVSERTVRNYCADGRIPGAELIGKTWAIPEGAERPGRRPRTQTKPRALLDVLFDGNERLAPPSSVRLDPAAGRAIVRAEAREGAFHRVLGEMCGAEIGDDFALMSYVVSLGEAKKLYDRVGRAFEDAKEYGYGIVPPEGDEMSLSEPKVVKKGGRVGVDLHADAPSYHIIRVDLSGEVRPALGNEEQSEEFAKTLAENMETQPEVAWNTNMFGKTLKELLGDELYLKNRSMAENVQKKMRRTVTRIVNEGKGGVICILI